MSETKTSFYQWTLSELEGWCQDLGLPKATAGYMYNWYYKKNRREICDFHNMTPKTKDIISREFDFSLPKSATVHESFDKTVKFLFQLEDGKKIESVLIPFHQKYTLCVSSQVGCQMNCSFCYTGKQGFVRHLKTEEIVGQFLQAKKWLSEHRPGDELISNVVFMGQGEPLHNFDAVKKAVEIFILQNGLSLADQKITISTSGYLPGLKRWKDEMPSVNLALSLHSPYEEIRNELIPINRRYPLKEIIKVIDEIPLKAKRFVTYEYLLIKGLNDSENDAKTTGELLRERRAFLNIIPFNPFPGSKYQRPDDFTVAHFRKTLEEFNIPALVRVTKGDEILAACGQLHTS